MGETPPSPTPLHLGGELRARAEAAARADGVSLSAWIEYAVAEKLADRDRLIEGRALIRDWEAEYGPIPAEVREATRRELEEAGVLPPRESP
jgi:hypothetical protein